MLPHHAQTVRQREICLSLVLFFVWRNVLYNKEGITREFLIMCFIVGSEERHGAAPPGNV